jgi:hypothetical protein
VSREIGIVGVKLAPFAGAHNLVGVSDRGGPIKALVERIAHEGVWRCVVATHAHVNLHEFVCLVVLARDVIELDAVKFILEGVHSVAVCFHLLVVAARVLHDLVNHELRVSLDVEALDACFDGDSEAAEEGLVFHHIVGRREVQAYCVSHVLSEGFHH